MITQNELNDKYGTGVVHTEPASLHSPDGKLRPSYWCQAHLGDILREYMDHLYYPATGRERLHIEVSQDGVIRTELADITDEELEWAHVEYILRQSINKCFGSNNVEFVVTVKEDKNGMSEL